jgi:hypothetical protein
MRYFCMLLELEALLFDPIREPEVRKTESNHMKCRKVTTLDKQGENMADFNERTRPYIRMGGKY